MSDTYEQVYAESMTNPTEFWAREAEDIHWYKRWHSVLDDSRPPFYRWFVGGEVNSCYNALDLHVENGRGNQLALVVERPPKTRSGKILRGMMKKIADGKEYGMPATIDDPAVLRGIESALAGMN